MRSLANLRRLVGHFSRAQDGATAIEYSLIVALIFLVIVVAVRSVATSTNDMYSTIVSTLPG